MAVFGKEAHHLCAGVRAKRIGVGAAGGTAEPGMPSTVHDPLLQKLSGFA
jgi:hypothetical protein